MLSAQSTRICIKTIKKHYVHMYRHWLVQTGVYFIRALFLKSSLFMECSLEFHVSFEGSINLNSIQIKFGDYCNYYFIIIIYFFFFGNEPFQIECCKAKTRDLSCIQITDEPIKIRTKSMSPSQSAGK